MSATPPPHGASANARALVGACVATLLCLLAPAPGRAADGYPRLGLYGHVNGQGAPIVTANGTLDQALLDRIAARHLVVLDATPLTEYRPDVLAALRARNPQIKLIGYVQGSYAFAHNNGDPQTHLPTRLRNLLTSINGYLYDLEGQEYDTANMNLAKRDGTGRYVVAEAVADFFVDEILATGLWDGMYFDRFCQSLTWMQTPGWTVDHVRAGYPSFAAFDAGWAAGTDTLANRVRRRAGFSKILIGNCGQGSKYAAFNGWMRENFPYQNGGTWQTNLLWNVGGYLTDEPKFLKPSAGWMTVWPAGGNGTPYSATNVQKQRMVLASAALGDGFGSVNPPDMDPMTGYMGWWYDEFAVNRVTGAATGRAADTGWLGQPNGTWKQMFWIQPGVPDATTLNPSFESSVTTGWTFVTMNGATVARDASTSGHGLASAKIHIPVDGQYYATQFTSTGSVPYVNDTYSATFWARASTARSITVGVVNLADTPLFQQLVPITTTWKRYQVLFTGQTNTVKIQFRLGTNAGDVWLDDVHFQRGAPNVYRRDFDYGTVLVNPSAVVYDVAMEKTFRRILGTQDPTVNNGTSGSLVRVNANDAVFLLKTIEELVGVDPSPESDAAASGPIAWASVSPSPARAGAETVRLTLAVRQALETRVELYDARGRRVRDLYAGRLEPGTHPIAWDGRDDAGRAVAPGLYFARARAGASVAVRKLVCR